MGGMTKSKVNTRRFSENRSHLGFISEMMAGAPSVEDSFEDTPIERRRALERIEMLRRMNRQEVWSSS